MPTTRIPWIFPICPTSDPTAPAAADTTSVSPSFGWPIWRRPNHAVRPMWPSRPKCAESGSGMGGSFVSAAAGRTA